MSQTADGENLAENLLLRREQNHENAAILAPVK